jgi:hypothetical protein
MKILCAYSGIEFSVEHFPYYLSNSQSVHPIFEIPQKKLLSKLKVWSEGELSPTESYLYTLAILNSSELIHWYTAAKRTAFTPSIIAQNMEGLTKAILKLNTVSDPASVFPSFAITKETADLKNLKEWIADWEQAYKDFKDGYKSAHDSRKLLAREAALQRLIKSPHAPVHKISSQIAAWAAQAGSFPTFLISSPFIKNTQITCSDYWQTLIIRCAKNENIYALNQQDLEELLSHCEEHIPIGSIYSNNLFSVLRKGLAKNKDFLGLSTLGSYTLLETQAEQDVEAANLLSIINSAPSEEPKKEDYPSSFRYLQAKLRWDAAKKSGKIQPKKEDPDEEGALA